MSQYLLISTLFLVLLSNNCCIYFYFYSLHHVIGEKIKLKKIIYSEQGLDQSSIFGPSVFEEY